MTSKVKKSNHMDKAKEIIYTQFEAFISFLLTDMGIGYHNMDSIIFYKEDKNDVTKSKDRKQKLKTFYNLLEESNRNYVIFYSKLPLDIKKNLFNYNQEELPVEYRLKCDFSTFDMLMLRFVKFEKRMLVESYRVLSEIFHLPFSKEQKMDLDEGKWIDKYNDAIHCYVKWVAYGKRSYILIKQTRTFWNSFRFYLLAKE